MVRTNQPLHRLQDNAKLSGSRRQSLFGLYCNNLLNYGRWLPPKAFSALADEDGNCRDTRAETLIRQSDIPVAFADAAGCQVKSGRWYDPYTNNIFTDDNDLDIDHIVPLKWAYEHGANTWPENIRAAFANDTLNVIAVSLSANRSKGAKGPTEWMPANQQFRCQYLERFQRVIRKYQLSLQATETRVLNKQVSACATTG
ncbi:HNH endonuclease family protein [uncultured Alteromonas sp.]|jgi:hypothetical protein|uniref:HNH endonuclease family protein n=1 Tax=uncultured Alteromonas sp. TaxID=179113 RepID=UPI0025D80A76|nr:HNH endonuclease family protein [uncultured Alteromonas sp.]